MGITIRNPLVWCKVMIQLTTAVAWDAVAWTGTCPRVAGHGQLQSYCAAGFL